MMTLVATLLHEIPHEIGDFVILLKSGLTYWQAALAQVIGFQFLFDFPQMLILLLKLMTASAGLIGAIFALAYTTAKDAGDATSWILPFTSGGFLYIGLVGILPDIVNETDLSMSVKQLFSLVFGVFLIFLVASIFE
jgi:zinc transporter 13